MKTSARNECFWKFGSIPHNHSVLQIEKKLFEFVHKHAKKSNAIQGTIFI